jgi:signal transduction histidine kinase
MGRDSEITDLQAEVQRLQQEVELRTQQLIASTSRAYSFLDALNRGFVMTDIHGEVVLANNSARRILLDGAVDALTIDHIDDLLRPGLAVKHLVLECLESGQAHEIKEVNHGKRVLHLFLAPMTNEVSPGNTQQIGAIMLIEDVTEQKVLERSKDEFLSIASHELRTPLTAIRGNAALIQKFYGDKLPDQDVSEMVGDIHESSIRLIGIVNDFLDASALEQGKMVMKPEAFSLEEPINEVVRELHALCESKGIELIYQPSESSQAPVFADKQRVKQIVYNLIGNAVKFTEHGSITITNRGDDHFIYTLVTDTGRGMPPESQRLLFRKFQQAGDSLLTRDTTKGTGLGLYISKLIVEKLDGRIALENSEPGVGRTFAFSLPRASN